MKTIARLAIVMIAIATIFSFSAVAAGKPEDIPPDGPLADISTLLSEIYDFVDSIFHITQTMNANVTTLQKSMDDNFTDVDTALDGLQTDMTQIKTDVATPEYIMYTSGSFATPYQGPAPGLPPGGIVLMAPDLGETLTVEVKTWEASGDPITFTNTQLCGDDGYVTLDSANQLYYCPFWETSTMYVNQIIVPADHREKVTFYAAVQSTDDYSRVFEPGDFKVDPIY